MLILPDIQVLQNKIKLIPNVPIDTSPAGLSQSVPLLKHISDPTTRNAIIHAYAQSISVIWLVDVPIAAVGLLLSFLVRKYTLKRAVVRQGDAPAAPAAGDVEKGSESVTEGVELTPAGGPADGDAGTVVASVTETEPKPETQDISETTSREE